MSVRSLSWLKVIPVLLLLWSFLPGAEAAQARPAKLSVEYVYAPDGMLAGRTVNGQVQRFEYDKRGQLLAVKDSQGNDLERYVYDPAGNILSKTVHGKTTRFSYDAANQITSRTNPDGSVVQYRYDAAGRLVQEGTRSYVYGYQDKVEEIRENGKTVARFAYGLDGQLKSVTREDGREENFYWDGLALIGRGKSTFINEPYVTGGNPIASDGKTMLNDMLGSTVGVQDGEKMIPVSMTAFGESSDLEAMYTGKPYVDGLGYAFLFRNYRADKGKWLSTDPLGYPDGWNNFAYVNNMVTKSVDFWGGLNFTLRAGILEDHSPKALPAYVNSSIALSEDYVNLGLAYASMETVLYDCPLAYSFADNYLSATGNSQTITAGDIYDIFCSEFSDIRRIATSYIKSLNLQPGDSVSFSSGWDNGYRANQSKNLLLAVNWIYYGIGGVASKNADGEISVSITIKVWDYYDFEPTGSALGGYDIYDATWYRFATIGFAKPFNVNGQYRMDVFIIPE